jgi:hypothetical protein
MNELRMNVGRIKKQGSGQQETKGNKENTHVLALTLRGVDDTRNYEKATRGGCCRIVACLFKDRGEGFYQIVNCGNHSLTPQQHLREERLLFLLLLLLLLLLPIVAQWRGWNFSCRVNDSKRRMLLL